MPTGAEPALSIAGACRRYDDDRPGKEPRYLAPPPLENDALRRSWQGARNSYYYRIISLY